MNIESFEMRILSVKHWIYLFTLQNRVQQSQNKKKDTFVDRKMIDAFVSYLYPLSNNS